MFWKGKLCIIVPPQNTQHFTDLAQHNSGGAYQSLAVEWFPFHFKKKNFSKNKYQKNFGTLGVKKKKHQVLTQKKSLKKTRQLYEPTPSGGMVGGGPGCSTSGSKMVGLFFLTAVFSYLWYGYILIYIHVGGWTPLWKVWVKLEIFPR